MKRILGAVAGVSLVTLIFASSATAQASNPLTFGIAGGLSQPLGDLGDATSLGFNVTGTLDARPAVIPFPLRFDLMINRWGLDRVDGSARAIAGVANAVFNFPTQNPATSLAPYVIGGFGIYNAGFNFDDADDPDSETDLGINFGGGVRFPLSGFDTYVEARYHNVFGGDDEGDVSFLPIVFGIRF